MDQNTIFLDNIEQELMQEDVQEDQNIGISEFFVQLSEICREVLMDWSDGFSMEEVAARNGLRNAHTARSKRYNCFKQLMAILQMNNIVNANINIKTDEE